MEEPSQKERFSLPVSFLFFGAGVALLVLAVVFLNRDLRNRETAVQTTATVVSVSENMLNSTMTVTFDVNGETFEGDISYDGEKRPSQAVGVWYNTENPEEVWAVRPGYGNFTVLVFLGVALTGIFGVLILIKIRNRRRGQSADAEE